MIERELKLHVPQAARAPIAKALRAQKARRTSLHACYYDTATRELAHARIALRLRKEGRHWVQTVKAPGADALTRIEVNHVRPGPTLDLQLYDGTPLQGLLAALEHPLLPRYETKVTRLVLQATLDGSVVEVAYDQGIVLAGGLELPISEVEFELVSGDIASVFDLGEQWLERYGLILDLRSKAERGDALAAFAFKPEGASASAEAQANAAAGLWPARRAKTPALKGKTGIAAAYQLCANECLSQIIQNTAYIAGVDTALAGKAAHVEYVHQARVGIRRLRSCWKLFKHHVEPAEAAAEAQLRRGFGLFGGSRDADIIQLTVEPQLIDAGLPAYQPSRAQPEPHARPETVAAGAPLQSALLRLLRQLVVLGEPANTPTAADANKAKLIAAQLDGIEAGAPVRATSDSRSDDAPALRPVLTKRLNGWLRKIAKAGSEFTSLPIDKQHDVRKEVKSLRYCLDFAEHLLAKPELRPLRSSLAQIQAVLGDLNDYYVAEGYYRPLVQAQPQLWFAVGWLRAAQDHRKTLAQVLFRKLDEHKPLKK
ncbi:CYTH and CHAD domain-containing protein [Eoetvoesiella caeni]